MKLTLIGSYTSERQAFQDTNLEFYKYWTTLLEYPNFCIQVSGFVGKLREKSQNIGLKYWSQDLNKVSWSPSSVELSSIIRKSKRNIE